MKKLFFALLALVLLIAPVSFAKQGHMKLLAVKETDTGYEGGIADLYLEIKPGSGRVFLETFPLTRTDTQMSTRFAKAIACDILEKDCNDLDFFYTITADSAIVAGPSAGAATAVLTVAMLEGLELDEDYAITGTINSGGLIGPVGGLKAKVEAAKKAGLKKVLIPAGEIIIRQDNTTIDLKNLSKELNIGIMEASTLAEALKQFTGKDILKEFNNIEISEEYITTMKSLAKGLCERNSRLKSRIDNFNFSANVSGLKANAANLTSKGKEAFEKGTFYSSASYCFGANVEYSNLILISQNLSKEEAVEQVYKISSAIYDFRRNVEEHDKKTITDLEAYIVITERLAEAEQSVGDVLRILNRTNRTDIVTRDMAYASERINSANSWAAFLGKSGKTFNLNKDVLKKSCQNKISEAEEGKQYVELYFPGPLENIKRGMQAAADELKKGNYELCLSHASKAKADVDVILNFLGIDENHYLNIIETKLRIVRDRIARQASKGIFPILGYSYYEYANSLKDTDIVSAMLYSEYALELSNLDIYFKEASPKSFDYGIDNDKLSIFLMGVFIGFIAAYAIRGKAQKKGRKTRA